MPNQGKDSDAMVEPDSIFYKLGQSGLISFSDYIFLLTVLSSESGLCFVQVLHSLYENSSNLIIRIQSSVHNFFVFVNF